MQALQATGRQAEALRVYRSFRTGSPRRPGSIRPPSSSELESAIARR